jgi:hypothetical protein
MENSRLARQTRRMIVDNKMKQRRISDIGSDFIQIRSCDSIQPINSTGKSFIECGSSYNIDNEYILSKLSI